MKKLSVFVLGLMFSLGGTLSFAQEAVEGQRAGVFTPYAAEQVLLCPVAASGMGCQFPVSEIDRSESDIKSQLARSLSRSETSTEVARLTAAVLTWQHRSGFDRSSGVKYTVQPSVLVQILTESRGCLVHVAPNGQTLVLGYMESCNSQ